MAGTQQDTKTHKQTNTIQFDSSDAGGAFLFACYHMMEVLCGFVILINAKPKPV